jgi:hypothetical protein
MLPCPPSTPIGVGKAIVGNVEAGGGVLANGKDQAHVLATHAPGAALPSPDEDRQLADSR